MSDAVPDFPPIRRSVLVLTMTGLTASIAAVIVYPLVAVSLFERHGARGVGLVLLAASLLSLALPRARVSPVLRLGVRLGRAPALGVAALAAAAAALDHPLTLLLLPSLAYALAAAAFFASLSGGSSLIEQLVLWIHPYKPDFVGSYCRRVTAGWGIFFALHGAALAVIAVVAPGGWWRTWTTNVVLPTMVLFTVVEYLIRKTWFRYYPYGGPIDRLFAAFFPAEETEMGRRSQAYIDARRRQAARSQARS